MYCTNIVSQLFIGQVMGTAVGTKVFVEHGWRASAGVSMAWFGLQIAVLLVRGPHVERFTWFGYQGGLEARKSVVVAREKEKKRAEEEAAAAVDVDEREKKAPDYENGGSTPASDGDVHPDEKDPSRTV